MNMEKEVINKKMLHSKYDQSILNSTSKLAKPGDQEPRYTTVAGPVAKPGNQLLGTTHALGFKESTIYPVLTFAPTEDRSTLTSGHVYRLQKISEIQKEIENERERRNKLSKKYHRAARIISTVDSVLLGSTITLGAV